MVLMVGCVSDSKTHPTNPQLPVRSLLGKGFAIDTEYQEAIAVGVWRVTLSLTRPTGKGDRLFILHFELVRAYQELIK